MIRAQRHCGWRTRGSACGARGGDAVCGGAALSSAPLCPRPATRSASVLRSRCSSHNRALRVSVLSAQCSGCVDVSEARCVRTSRVSCARCAGEGSMSPLALLLPLLAAALLAANQIEDIPHNE
ncbi:hypothetical protein RR48_05509 [Papilio machaon]|uniref:Uncharacterized protein n=1 Tax=Papilio machaon TaxID=76193 RepID=A0A0N1PJX3_PAPMA|nr:hypothetical protein RR48_05509 [Papilio machaon]